MCMCGDIYCSSCGPAQGNYQCGNCGQWSQDGGCENPEECDKIMQECSKEEATEIQETEKEAQEYWNGPQPKNLEVGDLITNSQGHVYVVVKTQPVKIVRDLWEETEVELLFNYTVLSIRIEDMSQDSLNFRFNRNESFEVYSCDDCGKYGKWDPIPYRTSYDDYESVCWCDECRKKNIDE